MSQKDLRRCTSVFKKCNGTTERSAQECCRHRFVQNLEVHCMQKHNLADTCFQTVQFRTILCKISLACPRYCADFHDKLFVRISGLLFLLVSQFGNHKFLEVCSFAKFSRCTILYRLSSHATPISFF